MKNELAICQKMPLFNALPEEEWQRIAMSLPLTETIEMGEPLLRAGEASLLLLVRGEAAVHAAGHGRTAVMRRLSAGDLCGVATLFGETTPVSEVVALSTCCVQRVSRETVSRWLRECPAFAENYIAFLTDRIRFLNRRIANFTEDSTASRLLYYVREHVTPAGEFAVGSMTELARTLHVGRSSLYRAFEDLAQQGFIEETAAKRWKYKEEVL